MKTQQIPQEFEGRRSQVFFCMQPPAAVDRTPLRSIVSSEMGQVFSKEAPKVALKLDNAMVIVATQSPSTHGELFLAVEREEPDLAGRVTEPGFFLHGTFYTKEAVRDTDLISKSLEREELKMTVKSRALAEVWTHL